MNRRSLLGAASAVALSFSLSSAVLAQDAEFTIALVPGLTTDAFDAAIWPTVSPETCARLRAIPDYDATGCSFISHHHADLRSPRVAELKAQGAAILCWTIRTPPHETLARQIAQNITFEGYAAAFAA